MKNIKRNAVVVSVLLLICVAVYLNWSYNNKWGGGDSDMVSAEDQAMAKAEDQYENSLEGNEPDNAKGNEGEKKSSSYFANARLTRQQSRDEALNLLEQAASAQTASQEIIDGAMSSIAAMANFSMQEAQIENLLLAKDFTDCVVFMNQDSITVAVPAPAEGLSEAAVARITDVITSETGMPATQLKIIEVKDETAGERALPQEAQELPSAMEDQENLMEYFE